MSNSVDVILPQKIAHVFSAPRGSYQYRVLRGGRGSGKSVGAATMALLWGYADPLRILCIRQFQNSIRQSFYAELVKALENNTWLKPFYVVTKEGITGTNGTEFIFKGLDRNPHSVKSFADIDLTIVEEAEDIAEESWMNLEATVFRNELCEMWIVYNPKKENSPVDFRFIKSQSPGVIVENINYMDNPFFNGKMHALRERDLRIFDYATYAWIWLGQYLKNSKTQIFAGKFEIKEFTPDPKKWDGPYQGLDWGHNDPTAAVRCWVYDECLWFEYEAGGQYIELDDVVKVCSDAIPDWTKYTTTADSAQPSMISHVRRKGMDKVRASIKGPGSVVDGIKFMRSFRMIYIHPRCKNTANEFNLYSWKTDRNRIDPETGQPYILDEPVDAYNHWLDSGRYSIEAIMRRGKVDYRSWV